MWVYTHVWPYIILLNGFVSSCKICTTLVSYDNTNVHETIHRYVVMVHSYCTYVYLCCTFHANLYLCSVI